MKIFITYENEDYKASIPFKEIIDLFELTDDQINAVKSLVLQALRTT